MHFSSVSLYEYFLLVSYICTHWVLNPHLLPYSYEKGGVIWAIVHWCIHWPQFLWIECTFNHPFFFFDVLSIYRPKWLGNENLDPIREEKRKRSLNTKLRKYWQNRRLVEDKTQSSLKKPNPSKPREERVLMKITFLLLSFSFFIKLKK